LREGWQGGLIEGTPCGNGSTIAKTRNVREKLPELCRKYGFRTICDAGAGDLHWIRGVFSEYDLDRYMPFDLVPRDEAVQALDITKQVLPTCDVILCRHVLIHLDPLRIKKALALFAQASDYLLTSRYTLGSNYFNPNRQFNPLDLAQAPYSLGAPIDSIKEEDPGTSLALWKLR
jgi:hypothetical protein